MSKTNNINIALVIAIVAAVAITALVAFYTMENPGEFAVGGGPGTINQLSPLTVTGGYVKLSSSTAGFQVPSLVNCDTIDTDVDGKLSCGTDSSGAGGSSATTTINGVSGPDFTFATGTATGIGLNISTSTGTLTFTPTVSSGYNIPLTASTTNWNNFYDTPSTRITAGTGLSWSSNTLNSVWTTSGSNIHSNNSGNVGIGTTSPSEKLHVVGRTFLQSGAGIGLKFGADVNATTLTNNTRKFGRVGFPHYTTTEEDVLLFVGDSDGTNNILFFGGGSTAYNAATQLEFKTAASSTVLNGTTRMVINSSGNVGIGTTSPTGNLHVIGSTFPVGNFEIQNSSTGGIASSFRLTRRTGTAGVTGDGTGFVFSMLNAAGSLVNYNRISSVITDASTGAGDLLFETGASFTERMRITSSGNVGIGSTTPSAKLAITGTAGTDDIFAIASSTNSRLFTVTAAGNVGIGDTSPASLFTVGSGDLFQVNSSGDIITQSVGVDALESEDFGDFTCNGTTCPLDSSTVSSTTLTATGYATGRVLTASTTVSGGAVWAAAGGSGTVTSVDMTVPTGLAISGNPITTSGTLALSLTTGYSILASTTLGSLINDVSAKTSPADNDMFGLMDSAASSILKKFSWANLINAIEASAMVLTSSWDFGGATFLEIPNGTNPTANDPGEIAHDTTDNQVIVDDRVIRTSEEIFKVKLASTSLMMASSTSTDLPVLFDGYTVTDIACHIEGGTSKIISLFGETITCLTSVTQDDGTITSGTVAALATTSLMAGTDSGTWNWLNLTIYGNYTRE